MAHAVSSFRGKWVFILVLQSWFYAFGGVFVRDIFKDLIVLRQSCSPSGVCVADDSVSVASAFRRLPVNAFNYTKNYHDQGADNGKYIFKFSLLL